MGVVHPSFMRWIWEDENWPAFNVNEALLGPVLDRLEGCARDFERRVGGQFARSPEDSGEFELDLLVDSVMDSYAIEEEHLSRDSVRSSFIRAFWPSRQTLKPGDTQTRALAELYLRALEECGGGPDARGVAPLARGADRTG